MTHSQTILTRHDLYNLGITFSNTHLLHLEKIGAFPKRGYLSPQKVFWKADEVNQYLEGRFAARGIAQ
jgi:predicted DNA-binding transcriptional regulator AlpA